jgi:hypothetical protein
MTVNRDTISLSASFNEISWPYKTKTTYSLDLLGFQEFLSKHMYQKEGLGIIWFSFADEGKMSCTLI